MRLLSIEKAVAYLREGEIIAYPTEAVFGLGCCPHNEKALARLVALKARSPSKGMILIASDVTQILPFLDVSTLNDTQWQQILATWPGPFTWVFPASPKVPPLVRGDFTSIAVRITAHPTAKALCQAFNSALISTSANIATLAPCRTNQEVSQCFGENIAGVVAGELGGDKAPTKIKDALTGVVYRS